MNRVAAVERALLGLVKPPVVQAFLVVLCLMHGAVAEAQHRYAITKVEGPSPETFLAVSGLNDKGEIVGNIAGSGGGPAAFHWHRGVYRDLAAIVAPGTPFVEATGINKRSEIVGHFLGETTFEGFVLKRGRLNRFSNLLPGERALFTHGINNRGVVSGSSFDSNDGRSFLWDGRTVIQPPIAVLAFNDRNMTVGSVLGPQGTPVPMQWSGTQIIELELPTGASTGVAHIITNRNQILGRAFFSGDFFDRALRWNRDGVAELLPLLSTDQIGSAVSGMNEHGLITGVTVNEDGSTVPTIWINNEPHDLNGLVTPDDPLRGYVFTSAGPVNKRGQIVASGMDPATGLRITVLLTPKKH